MSEVLNLLPGLGVGFLLGLVFFGGLWWTVRRGLTARRPALLFLSSLALRTGICLGGFYLVSEGRWERLAACVVGFVLARLAVTRLAGPPLGPSSSPAQGA